MKRKRNNFKGKNNPFYGKKHTEESRRKMSLVHKGHVAWNKGKTRVYSEEALSKMRKPKTEDHKRKTSIAMLKRSKAITDRKIVKFKQEINQNLWAKIAFGEILGTIPSDACFNKRDKRLYNYFLDSMDKEFIEKMSDNFARLGIKTSILRRSSDLWYVQVCRRWFRTFLSYLDKKGNKWIFSDKVLNSLDKEFKAAIIRSFSDADGTATCTIKNGRFYSRHIAIYNSLKILLLQINRILSSFGISSRIYLLRKGREAKIKNRLFKFSTSYSLSITNYKNLKLFYNTVGFGLTRKRRKLKEMLDSYKCIGKQYSVKDYREVLLLYKKVKNCREVSRQLNIPPQTIQNWVLHNIKPRLVKIYLRKSGL